MTTNKAATDEKDRLVSMANDIAANLSFQADATGKIADHINRFWAPRMRCLLLEYASDDGQDISEALLPALSKLRK